MSKLSRSSPEVNAYKTDHSSYPGAPRWVKVSGIIIAVLVLLVVIMRLTGLGGEHGPGRHMQHGGNSGAVSSEPEKR